MNVKVVKIGGHILNDADKLQQFLVAFTCIEGPKILVHGGGRNATELAHRLGIRTNLINGRRITDAPMLEVVTMTYSALNKQLVAMLQGLGCNAIGLSGADAGVVAAKKREHPEIDFGYVGDIDHVRFDILDTLMKSGVTPVLCALTHDGNGGLLNTNADTIAAAVASKNKEYHAELIYCFEKRGVLMDMNNDHSLVNELTHAKYQEMLHAGKINNGMKPKLENAFKALASGVGAVRITHYNKMTGGTKVTL